MSIRQTLIVLLIILVMSAAAGAYAYPRLPERVATHWNAAGEVDGYSSPLSGVLLLPLVLAGVSLLMLFLPEIDPLKANIARFRRQYNRLVVVFAAFMFYLYLLTLLQNLGPRFNLVQALAPAFAALFYYSGVLLGHAQRNFFIGIRTPWTLSSDSVWRQTHRRGALLFKLAGGAALLGVLLPHYAIWLVLAPVLLAALYSVVFSYLIFRQEANRPAG